jgi:hypothetical protein
MIDKYIGVGGGGNQCQGLVVYSHKTVHKLFNRLHVEVPLLHHMKDF